MPPSATAACNELTDPCKVATSLAVLCISTTASAKALAVAAPIVSAVIAPSPVIFNFEASIIPAFKCLVSIASLFIFPDTTASSPSFNAVINPSKIKLSKDICLDTPLLTIYIRVLLVTFSSSSGVSCVIFLPMAIIIFI